MALSNSQYNALMREYERQQSLDRNELKIRTEEVYAKIPEMRKLSNQAGESALRRYRSFTGEGKKDALKDFSKEIENIQEQKKKLLKDNGFPEDFLQMHYLCQDCKDTGLIDGKKCHCFQAKIIRLLYAQSHIEKKLDEENFETFSYDFFDDTKKIAAIGRTQKEYMHDIVKLCIEYTETFEKKHGNILFMGSTGVGKTFLTNCIARALMDRYYSVIYLTAGELFDCVTMVRMDKTDNTAMTELYSFLGECDLLIVDDLGTEMTNTWTATQFFSILNARLTSKRATILSTNLSMRSMRDTYSERVTSRISDGYTIIPLYGEDIRLKKNL